MANKNKHVIIAYFPGVDKAEQAAHQIKDWDKANDDIKLGGIGILTWGDGKIQTHKVGARATSKGAKWGLALGAATGILSGGVTLVGGAIAGVAGGALVGALFHRSLGLSDDDRARLERRLQDGGAALVVMGDEDEVEPTQSELARLGGDVENFQVPEETMGQVESAEKVIPVDMDVEVEESAGDAVSDMVVNVPGTWQPAFYDACDAWDPACTSTYLAEQADGTYSGTFALPEGDYAVKVALNGSWDENYGVDGVRDGANIQFQLATDGSVTFTYDPESHLLAIDLA